MAAAACGGRGRVGGRDDHAASPATPATGSRPRSSATRSGSTSASRSACGWSRRCWPPAASSSATRRCGSGRCKFGQAFANQIRRRLPRAGDKWHLDEVVINIAGKKHWLWRAVDQDGIVLDVLVQSRRDKQAAKRLLRKLLKRQCRPPRVMITDKLASYGAAKKEIMPGVEHRQHKGLNNRAENSHQPTRRRERQMKRFKSAGQAQRFLSAHDQINNLFPLRRDHVSAISIAPPAPGLSDLGRGHRRGRFGIVVRAPRPSRAYYLDLSRTN